MEAKEIKYIKERIATLQIESEQLKKQAFSQPYNASRLHAKDMAATQTYKELLDLLEKFEGKK